MTNIKIRSDELIECPCCGVNECFRKMIFTETLEQINGYEQITHTRCNPGLYELNLKVELTCDKCGYYSSGKVFSFRDNSFEIPVNISTTIKENEEKHNFDLFRSKITKTYTFPRMEKK
jgi:hypothetical protein